MSIKMQGPWLVRVKSKEAAAQQKFRIDSSTVNSGTYDGVAGSPERFFDGPNWSITILNNAGGGPFKPSSMQIKYPVVSGGYYSFDIESNDAGADEDYNDLILTCRTPVDANDYIIFGNVSYYSGRCVFNPCNRRYGVIDTLATLKEAVINPVIRDLVKTYYPSRLKQIDRAMLNPQPLPPNPGDPFVPLILPLLESKAIPDRQAFTVNGASETLKVNTEAEGKSKEMNFNFTRLVSKEKINPVSSSAMMLRASEVSDKLRIDAAKIADRYRAFCESGPLPDAILRFKEYDRSPAELAGDPYSGTGDRQDLGGSFTDRNGNYIFRFRTNAGDVIDELTSDTGPAEDGPNVQFAPDVLVQLLCPGSSIPVYETAPVWNIGYNNPSNHLQRINICVPKSKSCLIPLACNGQHILQGVGNIVLGPPTVTGQRTGSNNYLNSSGIITAYGDGAPPVRCAAWNGRLQLRGCLKNGAVKYYRLYSRPNTFGSPFVEFIQQFSLPRFSGPNVVEQPVFDPSVNAYLNVETDVVNHWLEAYKNIKARINTYAFTSGSYVFKIQGLDASLNPVPNTDETIVLYLENGSVTADIDPDITMEGVGTLGECALFTLPKDGGGTTIESPGLTVKFRAVHNLIGSKGFMNSYGLSMQKGASAFAITPGAVPANFSGPGVLDGTPNSGRSYVHTDNLICITNFRGTINEPTADGDGYYSVTLHPASGGWLNQDQPFCAFGVFLNGNLRLTNGENGYPDFYGGAVLIGIQR